MDCQCADWVIADYKTPVVPGEHHHRNCEHWKPPVRVFRMDDLEYWAGESLEACVAEGRRVCGDDCYPDDPHEQYEVTDEGMQRLKFIDDDGSTRTFAEELARRFKAGETFPQPFAAEDC